MTIHPRYQQSAQPTITHLSWHNSRETEPDKTEIGKRENTVILGHSRDLEKGPV